MQFTRYTKNSENQPLKTIERRKLSKEKSVPIISKRQVPEQEFVDELRRVDRLVERETYCISKYRVIQQRESRSDLGPAFEWLFIFLHFDHQFSIFILIYNHLSFVVILNYISPFIIIYYDPLSFIIYHHLSLFIIIYHHLSLFIIISH